MGKVDLKIVTTGKQFHNGAIAIEKEKCRINFNKTVYIGASIF